MSDNQPTPSPSTGVEGAGHQQEPGWAPREADFELERVLAAARRGLFGEEAAAPTRIGRHRIEARLGAGGMGEVYLGVDESLGRKVAIKLVLPSLHGKQGGKQGVERLRLEARALARLSHPNVVQVYEVDEHDGRTYLAMEYVEGQTLGAWLQVESRSWSAILARFVAAGRGLAAAHAAGVIHRDFKADNVLLAADGRVCVADFGLARTELDVDAAVPGGDGPGAERRSTVGAVGTIRYMPLEQLDAGNVDARADQFAYCVALYEALWSTPPFAIDSVEARRAALEDDRPTTPPRSAVPRGLWRV
ncbi:MAG: serine/threonine protein kinase, partial [Myxococcales bacterium]|nr:serine/threonine protein kinase [Myxococcales bacterium]